MVYSPKRSQGSNKNISLYAKIILHYYLWLQTLGLGRISMLKSNVHFLYMATDYFRFLVIFWAKTPPPRFKVPKNGFLASHTYFRVYLHILGAFSIFKVARQLR